jgi:hypothetical protein
MSSEKQKRKYVIRKVEKICVIRNVEKKIRVIKNLENKICVIRNLENKMCHQKFR